MMKSQTTQSQGMTKYVIQLTVRNLITTMMCMHCLKVQPAGQDCIECGEQVSKYYCKECKLWDDDPKKNIYHCHDCGICRIGKGLGIDYFHCKTCNVCMAIGLKGRHKCIERNLESDCPICGEYMFTSTSTVIFMVPFSFCIANIKSPAAIACITNAINNTFKHLINAQHA